MATSYKTLYLEEKARADSLSSTVARLTHLLAEDPEEIRRQLIELQRSRQIVDLAGIARHMHVDRYTPQQWRQRKLLPPVDFPEIEFGPLWWATSIIEHFVIPTKRSWCDDPETCELSRAS